MGARTGGSSRSDGPGQNGSDSRFGESASGIRAVLYRAGDERGGDGTHAPRAGARFGSMSGPLGPPYRTALCSPLPAITPRSGDRL